VAQPSRKQRVFVEWVLGTLLYAVVLGFFNDYTELLRIASFSTLFAAALVLQALTAATFRVKDIVTKPFKDRSSRRSRLGYGLSLWAISFFSKFVFLEVIVLIFGSAVKINGFVGLMLIVMTMVAAQKAIEKTYTKLGTAV
jgi:hypothetical protein